MRVLLITLNSRITDVVIDVLDNRDQLALKNQTMTQHNTSFYLCWTVVLHSQPYKSCIFLCVCVCVSVFLQGSVGCCGVSAWWLMILLRQGTNTLQRPSACQELGMMGNGAVPLCVAPVTLRALSKSVKAVFLSLYSISEWKCLIAAPSILRQLTNRKNLAENFLFSQ